ncbi:MULTISPECIES: hypothetical protein [Salinimonas]|uniref:Uncharacterized protein n=2 Tax=Salinimonas TaxID=288793 RepID=A0A5B7YIZ3_9ALTE|nr:MULTISPECIES: hypothetical protein [Salinimonas]MBD3587545.1 hypothetical protein [Salinimonas profundi]QCZ95541.1 hypothetical protein FBQ74_18650 [Salinimonas iocasae]
MKIQAVVNEKDTCVFEIQQVSKLREVRVTVNYKTGAITYSDPKGRMTNEEKALFVEGILTTLEKCVQNCLSLMKTNPSTALKNLVKMWQGQQKAIRDANVYIQLAS